MSTSENNPYSYGQLILEIAAKNKQRSEATKEKCDRDSNIHVFFGSSVTKCYSKDCVKTICPACEKLEHCSIFCDN